MVNPDRRALDETRAGAFFLIGCERSGTTLLQAMLASHPELAIASETQFYSAFHRRDPGSGGLRTPGRRKRALRRIAVHMSRRDLEFDAQRFGDLASGADPCWGDLFAAWLTAFREARGVDRVGEKSPAHTPYLAAMAKDFPRARFVHILRDPRAVVSSLLRVPFGSRFVAPNALAWRQAYRIHLASARLVDPSHYLMVRYEDLVLDPRPVVEQICCFLELPWHDEIENFHERSEPGFQAWENPWKAGTMQPVFASSIDAWKGRLHAGQIALVEGALAREMQEAGYLRTRPESSWSRSRWHTGRALGALEAAWRRGFGFLRRRTLGNRPLAAP